MIKLNSDIVSIYSHLRQFFTERQIEIISKKYNNEKLTKTEAEYYSRTIKKKLKAIANKDLLGMAKMLIEIST